MMMVTERIFVMVFLTGAVTFGSLISWLLWEPNIRRVASLLRGRMDGSHGGSGSARSRGAV